MARYSFLIRLFHSRLSADLYRRFRRGRDTRRRVPPRSDPYVRNYLIRLLPRVFGVKANIRIWVDDAGSGKPFALQAIEAFPRPALARFLTAPSDHPQPHSADLSVELAWRFHVSGHGMILGEPPYHAGQPRSDVHQRFVHPFDQLGFDFFQFPAEALLRGLAADAEFTPSRFPANVRETEEVKGFGFALVSLPAI